MPEQDIYVPEKVCRRTLKLLSEELNKTSEDRYQGIGRRPRPRPEILEVHRLDTCYGDMINYALPEERAVYMCFDQSFFTRFNLSDKNLVLEFEKLSERFLQPAMLELSRLIFETNKGSVLFAPLTVVPSDAGARSFVGNYENISLRCTMSYNSKKQGMDVVIDTLFATVNFEFCKIIEPKEPAITSGPVAHS